MRIAVLATLLVSTTAAADADDDGRILAAINRHDAVAFEKLGPNGINLTDIPWLDPSCAKQFGGVKTIKHDEVRALVACLAGLHLAVAPSGLVFEPGSSIVTSSFDGQLSLISASAGNPPAPVLQGDLALTFEPDQITRAAIAKSATEVAWTEIFVCFDTAGHAEEPVLLYSSHHVDFDHDALAAGAKLTHVPFKAHGKAVRACMSAKAQYPKDRPIPGKPQVVIVPKKRKVKDIVQPVKIQKIAPEENGVEGGVEGDMPPPPPPPPAPPRVVAPALIEKYRISGTKDILPDDATRAKMAADKKQKVVGSWKLCLDTSGAPTLVSLLKSTGYPTYDDAIAASVRAWRYQPIPIDGKPAAVCTAVTFIFALP